MVATGKLFSDRMVVELVKRERERRRLLQKF
jgi:hypothetical protein